MMTECVELPAYRQMRGLCDLLAVASPATAPLLVVVSLMLLGVDELLEDLPRAPLAGAPGVRLQVTVQLTAVVRLVPTVSRTALHRSSFFSWNTGETGCPLTSSPNTMPYSTHTCQKTQQKREINTNLMLETPLRQEDG